MNDQENGEKDVDAASTFPRAISRREVLSVAWLGAVVVLGSQSANILGALGRPLNGGGRDAIDEIVDLGGAASLPGPGDPPYIVPGMRMAFVAGDDGARMLHLVCPRRGVFLNWNASNNIFLCPACGSRFERDGTLLQGPATRSMDRHTLFVRDAEGKLLDQTSPDGDAVAIPPGTFVSVDPTSCLLGAPEPGSLSEQTSAEPVQGGCTVRPESTGHRAERRVRA